MDKDLLRQKFILKRKSLNSDFVFKKSKKVFENFKVCDFKTSIERVLIYLPINNEIDTLLITDYLRKTNVDLFLPAYEKSKWIVSEFVDNELTGGPSSTLQPAQVNSIDTDCLDLAIVPGVAFSKNGFRLGYGKGVYDKLLINFSGIKVGLAYDFQVVDTFIFEEHDVKMDYVITESKVIGISN